MAPETMATAGPSTSTGAGGDDGEAITVVVRMRKLTAWEKENVRDRFRASVMGVPSSVWLVRSSEMPWQNVCARELTACNGHFRAPQKQVSAWDKVSNSVVFRPRVASSMSSPSKTSAPLTPRLPTSYTFGMCDARWAAQCLGGGRKRTV